MPSDYTDYENNLAFPPRHDKTALELKQENNKLKSDLNNVLSVLLKVSPQHDEWIRVNYPEFYKEQANVWFE